MPYVRLTRDGNTLAREDRKREVWQRLGDRRLWEVLRQQSVNAVAAGWDFLFPPSCLLCGLAPRPKTGLCEECQRRVTTPRERMCHNCAAPIGPHLHAQARCMHCKAENYAFRRVLALGEYDAELRRAVLAGKTPHGAPYIVALTDAFLDSAISELLTETYDAIIPVPHHWQRRFWQMHSASETVAERLAKQLRRPYAPHILRKPLATPLQAAAAPSERRRQQRGAFDVVPGCRLDGLRLLLVDDVLTTGATAHAAAQTLRSAGAADVIVAVLARAIGRRGEADVPRA